MDPRAPVADRRTIPRSTSRASSLARRLAPLAVLTLLLGMAIVPGLGPAAPLLPRSAHSNAASPAVSPVTPAAAPAPRPASPRPADPTDSFLCRSLNQDVCVSAQNGSPDVVPSVGNTTSSTLPSANQSIFFWIKSKIPIYPLGSNPPTGESNLTPIRINVTGVLWNGDPYMTRYDETVWHANPNQPYFTAAPNGYVNNKTYKYWYQVSIRNFSAGGAANFFPGEYVSWWIYIVYKTPKAIDHLTSPTFYYRIGGAWAFSPYKGAVQYGGPNASSLDLAIRQTPLVPNWNDTVRLSLQATDPDILNNCSIGSAVVHVSAGLPNGAVLPNATIDFATTSSGSVPGIKGYYTTASIPAFYQQVPGTTVSYWITAFDAVGSHYTPDQIVTTVFSYIVGGNGTFISGNFANDIAVTTSPVAINASQFPGPSLYPDTNVTVTLTSRNPSTALQTAEVDYLASVPALHELTPGQAFFGRVNSTTLTLQLPPVPVGGFFNFTVLVWDYQGSIETSAQYAYSVVPFARLVPTIPSQLGFLWVYVFDNGTHRWVDGASVSITSASGFVNTTTRSQFGVAYPNQTGKPFVPLLLTANESYNVLVNDPRFFPASQATSESVHAFVTLRNPSTFFGTLVQATDYTVLVSGGGGATSLYFFLNTTGPGPSFAAGPPIEPTLIGPIVGLALAVGVLLILVPWWRQISARRKEQERRVTL
jgi:hypothetical protein